MSQPTDESNVAPADEHADVTVNRVGEAMAALKAAGDRGANWFFWIAALSLVNTVITHSGGGVHFIVGLAITMIVDAIAAEVGKQEPNLATVFMVIAVGFSIFVAAVVILFGWLSRKRFLWVFGAGMFLYLLDGLIYLLIGVYGCAAFHGYALFSMIHGFNSYRKLNQLEAAIQNAAAESVEPSEANPQPGFETA